MYNFRVDSITGSAGYIRDNNTIFSQKLIG